MSDISEDMELTDFEIVNEIHFNCPACGMKNKQSIDHIYNCWTECDECDQVLEIVE